MKSMNCVHLGYNKWSKRLDLHDFRFLGLYLSWQATTAKQTLKTSDSIASTSIIELTWSPFQLWQTSLAPIVAAVSHQLVYSPAIRTLTVGDHWSEMNVTLFTQLLNDQLPWVQFTTKSTLSLPPLKYDHLIARLIGNM